MKETLKSLGALAFALVVMHANDTSRERNKKADKKSATQIFFMGTIMFLCQSVSKQLARQNLFVSLSHHGPMLAAPLLDFIRLSNDSVVLIRDCIVMSGSFLGARLWHISPQANFIAAAICGLLGTVWFWCVYGERPTISRLL